MILIKTINDLQKTLAVYKSAGTRIGFVPTMGALHPGHISLMKNCRQQNDFTVCSIFVNPVQFNNTADYETYPASLEQDIYLLEAAGCHLLFLPSVSEMYPVGDRVKVYELGFIETLLEGKYRPGHFQGVCRIVDKLLAAVTPHNLYLGQKDYQQCMVIKKLMELQACKTHLHICPTMRETDGLAMSSRNLRLNATERNQSVHIIKTLQFIQTNIEPGSLSSLKEQASKLLTRHGFKIDYVEIANAQNLQIVHHWNGEEILVALVAVYLNEVRLIDNLVLNNT